MMDIAQQDLKLKRCSSTKEDPEFLREAGHN